MEHICRQRNLPIALNELRDQLRKCRSCQWNGELRRGERLSSMNDAQAPSDVLQMDSLGPVDNVRVLVEVDYFSRKLLLDICESDDFEHVVRGIHCWMEPRGHVRKFFTVQGRALATWLIERGVEHGKTLLSDHGSNGITKRYNHTV